MLKKISIVALLVGLMILPSLAQITTTSFTTTVPVATLNSNFSTLGANALNRTGGNLTGNVTANSGITVDGVDISAVLAGTGTPTFSTLTVSSTSASAIDVAGGINAGSGNVGIVDTSGKIPALSSTYIQNLSGANLTGLLFSQLTTTWTSPTYSGGFYTTNGAGGWTVEVGDVFANRYVEFGKTAHWNLILTTTTVTAATGTELRVTLPSSRTGAAAGIYSGQVNGLNNSATFNGIWQLNPGATYITLYVDPSTVTAWTAAANTTQIRLNATFEIS